MSAPADENTVRELLADLSTDSGDTHVLWPAEPEEESAGRLRIDLDDGHTWSGSPVSIEARLTISGHEEVQAVIRVQGLEPTWCPLPQVVAVSPEAPARLFVELSPAAGTPPGRYLWSLTAEVQDRPMLAATARLHVDRPQPTAPPPRRSRWRRTTALALAASTAVLLATLTALTVFAPSRVFWGRHPAEPGPSATGPSRLLPTARPSTAPSGDPALMKVLVKGTVLAELGKEPTQITVVRLTLSDLTGIRPTPAVPEPEPPGVEKRIRGEHWSLLLPPGLYGLTFSKPGYVPESIVVSTAVAGTVPRPHVRLDQIAPVPTGT
jgi:hypothetical protein